MFSQWLRRRDASPSPPLAKITTRTEPTAETLEQDTPTWSEASEASDFANVDVNHMGASASNPASAESSAHVLMTDQQSTAKLADRLGGWLTGMTNAAGAASLACMS